MRRAADTNANGRIETCDQADGYMNPNGIVDNPDIALLLLNFGPLA